MEGLFLPRSSTLTSSGATVTARNAAWNGTLAAGASTNFGFLGSWNNTHQRCPHPDLRRQLS